MKLQGPSEIWARTATQNSALGVGYGGATAHPLPDAQGYSSGGRGWGGGLPIGPIVSFSRQACSIRLGQDCGPDVA